ncbi:cilia- and flagella-associated protein 43-like [Ostrinia nubilalis]|uniref:cilia- and flagella-associated protein 43-like n=1 Tax=Ostrinia nubilalis TaxID=29057 RepID=UPI0030825425
MDNDDDLFRPWEEPEERASEDHSAAQVPEASVQSVKEARKSTESEAIVLELDSAEQVRGQPYVLAGSNVHRFVPVPAYSVPQTLAFSFLQMGWIQHLAKVTHLYRLAGWHVLAGSNVHRFVPVPAYSVPQTLAFSFLQMGWIQHLAKVTHLYRLAGWHVLAGSNVHRFVPVPAYSVPQTLAFSFLQMGWIQHLAKVTHLYRPAGWHVLAGSNVHRFVPVPAYSVPQTLAFSFLQMGWIQHLAKVTHLYRPAGWHVLAGSNVHRFVPVPAYSVPQALAFSFLQMGWIQHLAKVTHLYRPAGWHVLAGSNVHRFVPVPAYSVPQALAFSFLQMGWIQHLAKVTHLYRPAGWHVLAGSNVHRFVPVPVPAYSVPQTLAFSFLQMGWIQHLAKLNVQNMRLWFNKQFDDLMNLKKREVGLVEERNARLRFIIDELNKLSDLRGSFHHLIIEIKDPQWRQEEQPSKLIKVEPEECSIEPYISPSQIVIIPPDPGPKDDFRERALMDMMDGVLEKLWHEEIKKPIPMPQCMLDKDPEHFNEDDLRLVFDYEAKVRFRNDERDKYRKMLHAEYAKLAQVLNEGVVKFNQRVKEMWLTKLQVDSVIGQENLSLMRLRRANLDRVEAAERLEDMRKRPKWHQRATTTAAALHELAGSILASHRPVHMHPDCVEYYKGVEQLDLVSNMPPVMDEALWATMCKLRRAKIENEIRMRALVQETAFVESAQTGWQKAVQARRSHLASTADLIVQHRETQELLARNKTIQLVLPAGQVEIMTTGHMEDFEDATLILKEDIEKINNVILKVGEMKLRMMRKQMDFRKGILSTEWQHAQAKMKLRHMTQELYSYQRLKIPKELQLYLKNKELGYTEEQDYVRMEKEMEASKMSVNKLLAEQVRRVEELEVKVNKVTAQANALEKLVVALNVKVSEKRLHEDPLEPIRVRRIFKRRMETLVMRSQLIREVQANHTSVVLLQTELELLRLKTYPTLASFRTFS